MIDSSLKMSVEVSFLTEYAALLRQQLSSLFAPNSHCTTICISTDTYTILPESS